MSLTAGRQKCSSRIFLRLPSFCFSLYGGVMLNTIKKIVYSFEDALLMENHNLDIAFSYAVSIDSTLFIL